MLSFKSDASDEVAQLAQERRGWCDSNTAQWKKKKKEREATASRERGRRRRKSEGECGWFGCGGYRA